MLTHACLTSIAQLELNALLQEAANAIQGLERQRRSALQAIQAAQRASERTGSQPLETALLEMELVDRLGRLNAALDQVLCKIEGMVATPGLAPVGRRESLHGSEACLLHRWRFDWYQVGDEALGRTGGCRKNEPNFSLYS